MAISVAEKTFWVKSYPVLNRKPHLGVTELGQGFLLRGDIANHRTENDQKGGEIVRDGLGHPKNQSRDKDGEHGIVGP